MNADELLTAAREDLARGFTARAGTRLRQAGDAGNSQALVELASAVFRGRVPGSAREIRQRLESLSELVPAAHLLRARWRYAGTGGEAASDSALADIGVAATAGDRAAQIEIALAWNEFAGTDARRQVHAWLLAAGAVDEFGLREATAQPVDSDPAALPDAWAPLPVCAEPQILASEPDIRVAPDLLSPFECIWLCRHAAARLAPSRVIDPLTGRSLDDPIRTGLTACLDPAQPGVFDLRISERMAQAAGSTLGHAEPLAVLRYLPGEQYKPHYDWLDKAGLARDPLAAAGDRAITVLAYLNTPEAGGTTHFPRLDIRVPARRGQVLVFANVDSRATPSALAQHAGEPVIAGEKWIASLWLRERRLS
ncbi:MAG: prolyl hydroxylase family protein [Gammaproteobacteria bacterium]